MKFDGIKFDSVKKLHQKKYRTEFGHYLLEGEHLVLELQKAAHTQSYLQTSILFVTPDYEGWAKQHALDFTCNTITSKQMAQLSDTKTPPGIIACVPFAPSLGSSLAPPAELSQKSESSERCIYLHEVQDPGNLGTIIRTLAWFGNFRLLLSPNSVDPYNPKVVRSSMGAMFHVAIEQDVTLTQLTERFARFAYLDMQGENIRSPKFAEYDCYLFGNEARGVPRDALIACNADAFTISGSGAIDSLNLASAVNMSVYQLSK
mgnify:CR=1 FL=1